MKKFTSLLLLLAVVGCATIPQEKQDEFIQACSGNAICIVELEDAFLEKLKDEHEYKLVEYQQKYLYTLEWCETRADRVMERDYHCRGHRINNSKACQPQRLTDRFSCIRIDDFRRWSTERWTSE